MKLLKYTEQELRDAVANNTSIRQTLISLGIAGQGGNYRTIQKAIKHFNIDDSHFRGQGWSKGKTFTPKRPIESYLSNEFPIQSSKLRQRLIKEGMLKHQCNSCLLSEWLEEPIPLELHHIDGDHCNNNLDNLAVLCPNCHTLTPNYRGKNIKCEYVPKKKGIYVPKERKPRKIKPKKKCSCGSVISPTATNCRSCVPKNTKINWPSNEELFEMLSDSNYTQLGKTLGVSDNAIRKHLANHS